MNSTDRLLSILLAVLMVTSTMVLPLVATPTAAAQSAEEDATYDLEANEPNISNTESTAESTEDSTESSEDSSTSDSQELQIDEDGLKDDYTVQRGMGDLEVQEMRVENWNEVSGGATVETFIKGEVPTAHYPFKYPVTVTIEALEDGEVVASKKTQVVLRPHTQKTQWDQFTLDNFEEDDLKAYSSYASANFTFDQNNSSDYTFRVNLQSVYNSGLERQQQSTFTVDGQNTENTANVGAVIQTSNDYRELPTKARATSFKASTSNPVYMEDPSLPIRNNVSPQGNIEKFANMTSPSNDSAVMSSEDGELRVTTATEYIEPNTPQTLVFRYAMTGESDTINVVPIDAGGDEIDPSTDPYQMSRSNQDECIDGDVTSVCMITLSEDERDYINQHGELFLSFESDTSASAEILCQSVIGGGLEASAENVCGIQSVSDGAKPVYKPIITDFTIVREGENTLLDESSPIEMSSRNPDDYQVGITVKNAGTAPLQETERLQIFQNDTFSTPSEETITKSSGTDYDSNLDNQTVTYNLSKRYPTSNVTFTMNADTNGGVVELKIEDDQGDSIYRTYSNLDGTQEITLTELGGYTGDVTVTVNAIYNDPEDKPTVDSMELEAIDQSSTAKTGLDLGNFSGGSGSLAPGDTRTHIFDVSQIELADIVDPAVTLKAEFGEDTRGLVIKDVTDGTPKLVADAGGPYTAFIEVDQWTREQTSYDTIIANEQPGPEWEQNGTYSGDTSDEVTVTTTHENVPKVNLSTSEAIQYYKDNGYIRELEKQLPEYYQGDLKIKDIKYKNYKSDETVFGTKSEVSDASSLTFKEANWSSSGFTGEDVQSFKRARATMFRSSEGDLEFKTDNSDAIYFYGSGAGALVPKVLQVIEQEAKPNTGRDAPKCSETDQYPCWKRGEYIGTERTTDGYSETKCQSWENYHDPGPDWYLAEDSSFSQVCWKKVKVTEDYDKYEWQLIDEVEEVSLHIPQFRQYNQYDRPVYDMEIVWSMDRSAGTQYEWEGPRYTITPDTSPSSIGLDGSESQEKSTVPIEEYEWYIDGEPIDTNNLGTPSVEISEPGRHEVRLVVKGGGMTDTDTTHIDGETECDALSICGGADHPELSIGKVTEKVDIKYRKAAIETRLTETPNNNSRFEYRLRVNPAESVMRVRNNQDCSEGYTPTTHTLPDDKDKLQTDPLLGTVLDELDDGETREVIVCNRTKSALDSGPELFIHPKSIDSKDVRKFSLHADETKTFWKGSGIPKGGLTQVAYINPRYSDSITRGYQEFTVELQMLDTSKEDPSYETIDTADTRIEFCEADTVWECPDLNSDLDDKADGDDECPYIIGRTEFPCESDPPEEDQQRLVFGSRSDGWNVAKDDEYSALDNDGDNQYTFTTDERYIGTQPSFARDENSVYNPNTIEMFHDSNVVNDTSNLNTIVHYPLDTNAGDTYEGTIREFHLREVVQGWDSQAFEGQYSRDIDANRFISVWSPFNQNDERMHRKDIAWNFTNWTSEDAAYFTKTEPNYAGAIGVNINVDREDREGNYWLGLHKGVDGFNATGLNTDRLEYYRNEYGDDWEKEYKYDKRTYWDSSIDTGVNAPIGQGYLLEPGPNDVNDPSKYSYFSIANHVKWPGQASPQNELYPETDITAPTHSLDETLTNTDGRGYDVSFWYKPNIKKEGKTEYMVKREIDGDNNTSGNRVEGQDVITFTTEGDAPNVPENSELDEEELSLEVLTVGDTQNEYDEAFIDSARVDLLRYSEPGDKLKYLVWDDEESGDIVILQWWNMTDSTHPDVPENVNESDYYVEEYSPMIRSGNRKIVAQATHKRASIIYELSYIQPKKFMADKRFKFADYNNILNRNKAIAFSGIPFLQLRSKGRNKTVIRQHESSGWRHATIAVQPDTDTVFYYENVDDTEATVNVPEGLNDNVYSSNKMQLFMGAGWVDPNGIGGLREWGGKTSVKFSDVRIHEASGTRYFNIQSYYPERADLKTETRGIPQSEIDKVDTNEDLELEDKTFTRQNTRLRADILWDKDGIKEPTKLKITAVPTETNSPESDPDDEARYTVTYEYKPSAEGSGDNVERKVNNTLAKDVHYTEFETRITINTLPEQEGWKAPEIKRVALVNYNPDLPDRPPTPTDGSVQTSGDNDKVPGPATNDDGETTDKGGSINVAGQIAYEGADDQVPVRFIVRDNKTVIAEGQISTADKLTKSFSIGWNDLKEAGLEPRADAYKVEFVVIEDPDGRWERRTHPAGTFVMCEKNNNDCIG